jgi:rhamnosyltransferase
MNRKITGSSQVDVSARPKRIAVLLAAYNGAKYLGQQIASIVNQNGVDITLYISVDLSVDDTLNIVKSLANDDRRIRLLPYGRKYGSAARNFYRLVRDVDFSRFDYVAYSDQDDIWVPGKLWRAIEMLSRRGVGGYSSTVLAFWEDGKERIYVKSSRQRKYDYLFESASAGCTYVFKSEVAASLKALLISKSRLSDRFEMHDWLTYAFVRSRNLGWVIDQYPSVRYRQHNENVLGANVGSAAAKRRLKYVLSGSWTEQISVLLQILEVAPDHPVAKALRSGRVGYLGLAARASLCRRRLRDQIAFAFLMLLLAVSPRKRRGSGMQ